jgi:2-desacetyl-2-hydroxyethyl bacteriochlorophyllide A dehydrogenase
MPTGEKISARALWITAPRCAELRTAPLKAPGEGEAVVRALYSGISRGTERLVFNAEVPASEYRRMRAPLMEGDFPFPVKYGYAAVGIVTEGPPPLRDRTVFCLHPHQDRFVAPVSMLAVLPDSVPPRRAIFAANMETALNAMWDSGAGPGDRIVVVGAGVVGLLIARLAARLPGAEVTVVDVAPERAETARALGCGFAAPCAAPTGADVVFHASVTPQGLATAIHAAGFEGTIVEVSWFGDRATQVPLGGAFHSQRLKLVSSQVGQIATSRRPRWDYARRREAALSLLNDAALDALITEEIAFDDLAGSLARVFAPGAPGLQTLVRY